VRKGLKELDLLVVVDLFETETAAVDRKADGVTYLLPACSHVEEAGSVANSGRVLQWRERATLPKGNSKADLELLFRLAYWLDQKNAFSHISAKWADLGKLGLNAYNVLYGDRYGWKPTDATKFENVASPATVEVWQGDDLDPKMEIVYGSEWFAEQIYRELCDRRNGRLVAVRARIQHELG
jgi:anaerobic selenocysteine-containing dehydrogenase